MVEKKRGGDFYLISIMEKDETSVLEEELIQLTVKSLLVTLSDKPTLICYIWTKKS